MKNEKLYQILIALIPTIQIAFDAINSIGLEDDIRTIIGGSLILTMLILNGIKQYFDPLIKNTAVGISILLFFGYVAGGIIDHLEVFNFSENTDAIVRTAMLVIVSASGALSKTLFEQPRGYKINRDAT